MEDMRIEDRDIEIGIEEFLLLQDSIFRLKVQIPTLEELQELIDKNRAAQEKILAGMEEARLNLEAQIDEADGSSLWPFIYWANKLEALQAEAFFGRPPEATGPRIQDHIENFRRDWMAR